VRGWPVAAEHASGGAKSSVRTDSGEIEQRLSRPGSSRCSAFAPALVKFAGLSHPHGFIMSDLATEHFRPCRWRGVAARTFTDEGDKAVGGHGAGEGVALQKVTTEIAENFGML
jgi:hypothetical protein